MFRTEFPAWSDCDTRLTVFPRTVSDTQSLILYYKDFTFLSIVQKAGQKILR